MEGTAEQPERVRTRCFASEEARGSCLCSCHGPWVGNAEVCLRRANGDGVLNLGRGVRHDGGRQRRKHRRLCPLLR